MASPRNPETAPASLDKPARELWKLTLAQLRAQGTWSPSDAPLLGRYIANLQIARLARARIAAAEKLVGDHAYTTIGSQGQLVQAPDLRTARDAERDASTYAAELLLSPKARAQHAIALPPAGAGRLRALLDPAS